MLGDVGRQRQVKEAIVMSQRLIPISFAIGLYLASAPLALGQDWSQWRGADHSGVSAATELIDSWSKDGENLIWRADFTGRSTLAVFDGRTCGIGRVGDGVDRQEVVSCWNAEDGRLLWENRFNVYLTTVPFTRAGWAGVAGDAETGYLYAQGVDGHFWCFDRQGNIVWEWNLGEDLGRFSGYGGRTHSPIVDGDQVLLSVIGSIWGDRAAPRHRFFSFDKRTGKIIWITTAGTGIKDRNTQGTPIVATIGEQRLLIGGTADGWIYALKVGTGEEVWRFHLSKRGINTTPAVRGHMVYATHSEENLDEGVMGRVVAIDARGKGDITATGEVWRAPLLVGYSSPLIHQDRLYLVDNSANLLALDAQTGEEIWEHNFGKVGKGSPVWADGKIYVTEVNGNFHILEPGAKGAKELDAEHLTMGEERYAEVYGSPAIAYGRIYFATEEGVYCLGQKEAPFSSASAGSAMASNEMAPEGAKAAALLVVPAEVVVGAGEAVEFEVRSFDALGRSLGVVPATLALDGLKGKLSGNRFIGDPAAGTQTGKITASAGGLSASARLRVVGPLPWSENFDGFEVGKFPANWIGIPGKAAVQEVEGAGKVLVKPRSRIGVPRANFLMGSSDMADYTIQADMLGTVKGRRRPDMGLVNSGYTLDMQGNHQRLQVRSWAAELRMAETIDFSWEMGVWYTMKMRVDQEPGKTVIRGKVWKQGEAEPAEWSITAEDPHPTLSGSPGLYGYSPVEIYYDNVKVTVSK